MKFNKIQFEGYLDYIGQPKAPTFSFSSGRCTYVNAERASINDLSPMTLINSCKFKRKKPKNSDITIVRNIQFDFEYLSDPMKAIKVARLFMLFMAEHRFCQSNTPIILSGAGVHIIIPIDEIIVENGDKLNNAIKIIIEAKVEPLFKKACDIIGINMNLECYDISRLFSAPGTWRVGGKKPNEHPDLLNGVLRCWEKREHRKYPPKRENYICNTLREYILLELKRPSKTTSQFQKKQFIHGEMSEMEKMRFQMCKKFLHRYYDKYKIHEITQRHKAFAKLICATAAAFDKETAIYMATYINSMCGNGQKFVTNEVREAQRCLQNFVHSEKEKENVIIQKPEYTSHQDNDAFERWLREKVKHQSGARIPITIAYQKYIEWCEKDDSQEYTHKEFVKALCNKNIIDGNMNVQRYNGKVARCISGYIIFDENGIIPEQKILHIVKSNNENQQSDHKRKA